jgi:hypothetical protein
MIQFMMFCLKTAVLVWWRIKGQDDTTEGGDIVEPPAFAMVAKFETMSFLFFDRAER